MTNDKTSDPPLDLDMALQIVKDLPELAETDAVCFLAAACLVTYTADLADLSLKFARMADMMKDMAGRKFADGPTPRAN